MNAEQKAALGRFVEAVHARYCERLVDVVLFGSRARGDARDDSDYDLAVIIEDGDWDFWIEMMELGGLTYDSLIDDGITIQPWAVNQMAWEQPKTDVDHLLILNMKRDGQTLARPV